MNVSSPIEALLVNLGRYVCPVYVERDESYLFTAQHVIDTAGENELVIAGDDGFLKLRGDRVTLGHTPGVAYDVCVIRVHPEIASMLKTFYRFSEPNDVADVGEYDKLTLYAFLGYPHTRNKPRPSAVREVVAAPHYYAVREFLDISKLRTPEKDAAAHFAMAAPFKKATDINFNRRRPPEPYGISGGGVWKIQLDRATEMARPAHLVGIGIEYIREQNAFIATRIHAAIYAQLMLKGGSL